jgi:D-alanyl-D-alanine carboxypeptidase
MADHAVAAMASIAKSFVSSVILQLVDEKKLSLSDTLGQRLPGKLPASSAVTLEQMLRLESGIFNFAADERWLAPYIGGNLEHYWSPDALVGLAADHPPVFAPGTQFEYSNTNYTLLAMLIEQITGDSLANVMRDRITAPLGMTATTFETGSQTPGLLAHGYLVGMGEPLDVSGISASSIFGCGNLVSTPSDINKFYAALAAGKIVSKKQLPQMYLLDPLVPGTRYGMGLWHFDHQPTFLSCDDFVGHDGATVGYDTAAYTSVDGKRQFAVVVTSLTMESTAGDEVAHKAFFDLVNLAGCR